MSTPEKLCGASSGLWEISSLKTAPEIEVVSDTTDHGGAKGVRFTELYYDIPDGHGESIRIFARYARPVQTPPEGLPGLAWIHGGASIGSDDAVVEWASRGFAAMSMDLPGKGGEARSASRSEGPDMSDAATFSVTPAARDSYLYLCVNAVMRAVSVLVSRPEVDAKRIGLLGYSWGGVIALLVNGIDDRIAAACTVYGSGFIHKKSIWTESWIRNLQERETNLWVQCFDPSSYLSSQHGRTLFVGATADIYFPLCSFLRTWRGACCDKALAIALNRNHELGESSTAAIARWFGHTLQLGPALPDATAEQNEGKITVRTSLECPVAKVFIAAADSTDFLNAKWDSAEMSGGCGVWEAGLPKQDVPYIVRVVDGTGAAFVPCVHLPGVETTFECGPKGDCDC